MIATLPPVVWLDSSQGGSGLASDDAAADIASAKSAAAGISLPGPILIIDRTYDVESDPVSMADYVWRGFGERISTLSGSASVDFDGASFSGFRLTGTFDDTTPTGPLFAEDCQLDDFRGQVNARQCRISGTFSPVGYCVLEDCHFAQDSADAANPITVDLTNCTGFSATRCTGYVEFTNRNSATGTYRLNGSGVVAFRSSIVQWASFTLTGDWEVIARANGASAPLTDYSQGHARSTARAQANVVFANSSRGAWTVSGAQSISDTAIEVTAAVGGVAGEYIFVRNTGEIMQIASLSGTTYTVTRGVLGSVAQPISNGEQIYVGLPRQVVVDGINFIISVTGALLGGLGTAVQTVDAKVSVVQELARGILESNRHFATTLSAGATASDTVLSVSDDPQAGGISSGDRMVNVRTGEIVLASSSTTSTVTVTRGHAGTTAVAMNSGDRLVELSIRRTNYESLLGEVDNVMTEILNMASTLDGIGMAVSPIVSLLDLLRGNLDSMRFFRTTISDPILSVDTVIDVDDDPTSLPAGTIMQFVDTGEVVEIVSTTSGSVELLRGQAGTMATSHMSGTMLVAMLRRPEISAAIANVDSDVAAVDAAVADLDGDVAAVAAAVADLDSDVAAVAAAVSNVDSDVAAVSAAVADVDSDVAAVASAVADLDGDVAAVQGDVTSLLADVAAVHGDVLSILSLVASSPVAANLVRGLIAEAADALQEVDGNHVDSATTIALAGVDGVSDDHYAVVVRTGEVMLVTAVGSSSIDVTRGVASTTAQAINDGDEIYFLRRSEIVRRVIDLFVNDAETVDVGGGVREVTIYEQDGSTVKNRVTISADGLTRTRDI